MRDDYASAAGFDVLTDAETFPARNAGPPLVHAPDLMARPMTPRPWLVDGVIPGAQVTELRGDGGAGKSTLALQLCMCAVTGRAWLGMPVANGPAIYLASEDDGEELHRRLASIAVHLGVTNADLHGLHVWPLACDDPALVTLKGGGLEPTDRFDDLARHIEAIRPAVVVLDSRADVFGGEEMNRNQVRAFVALLRRLAVQSGAAVVILAHPSLSGQTNKTGNSGSTHWTNAVRSALYLRRTDQDRVATPNSDARSLEVLKSNYGPAGLVLPLRWSIGAFAVEDGPRSLSRQEAEAEADRVFLHLLARFTARGLRVRPTPGHGYAPRLFEREEGAAGIRSKGFEAAMRRLLDAGKIRVIEEGPPSRRHQYLAMAEG